MATIKIELDSEHLWASLWGSGFETDSVARNWLMTYEFLGSADWDCVGTARLWYIPEGADEEDEKFWGDDYQEHCAFKDVTLEDIENALGKAMQEGYRHVPCGGNIDTDLDRWDACVGDILLQLIAYGKEVWA